MSELIFCEYTNELTDVIHCHTCRHKYPGRASKYCQHQKNIKNLQEWEIKPIINTLKTHLIKGGDQDG